MGMFDYVRYQTNCLKCGTSLTEFQSKDHDCELATLAPWQVRNFYARCEACEHWNQYKVTITAEPQFEVRPSSEPV